MKIFSAEQFRNWDAYTIAHEPVSSIDLMERAATACCTWIREQNYEKQQLNIFCGKGNNGGDGLAIARMLIREDYNVSVFIRESGLKGSEDFQTNLQRLHECTTSINFIPEEAFFPALGKDDIIIDALFGTGLNKPLEAVDASLVRHINQSGASVIAIDMPSGLFADRSSIGCSVINATHTLSFQQYKLAFLMPENELYCGKVRILDIGLHPAFEQEENARFEMIYPAQVKHIIKDRSSFSHKGTYGHAAIIAGSYGMMGAAVLSAKAGLRSGAGKLTCYIPACGYIILQSAVPEVMCMVSGDKQMLQITGLEKYDAVGIGPGIGSSSANPELLRSVFTQISSPVLIDADALNTLAKDTSLFELIPSGSILTPHPGEFERLFGPVSNDFERLELALRKSAQYNVFILLKGHYSFISTPSGKGWFNTTGNPGMATAGSGDVLSGIITGLLAQGYDSTEATLLGVYLHGLAGDIAAEKLSEQAMIAGDIINHIGDAYKKSTRN